MYCVVFNSRWSEISTDRSTIETNRVQTDCLRCVVYFIYTVPFHPTRGFLPWKKLCFQSWRRLPCVFNLPTSRAWRHRLLVTWAGILCVLSSDDAILNQLQRMDRRWLTMSIWIFETPFPSSKSWSVETINNRIFILIFSYVTLCICAKFMIQRKCMRLNQTQLSTSMNDPKSKIFDRDLTILYTLFMNWYATQSFHSIECLSYSEWARHRKDRFR